MSRQKRDCVKLMKVFFFAFHRRWTILDENSTVR